MDTLTVVKKSFTMLADRSQIWTTYEFAETGERFESLSNDVYAAFLEYVKERELEDEIVTNFDGSESFHQDLALRLSMDCPYVPEDAMPKTAREEGIEKSLLKAYADVLNHDVHDLVCKNCEACESVDPSKEHHDCLMLPREIKVCRYLSEALQNVDDERVMEIFMKRVETMNPPLNAHWSLKYQCQDSRSEIVSRRRDELEDIIENVNE